MDQENSTNSEIENAENKDIENENKEKIETDIAQNNSNLTGNRDETWFIRTRNIVYYILGIIEVLLAFRLIFRSLGASTRNGLVALLYTITKVLISPFSGIFNIINPIGAWQFAIEPATIIAMVVYALLAYGLVKLVKVTAVSV